MREGAESRGIICSLRCASSRSSSVDFGLAMVSRSLARFTACCFTSFSRFLSRMIMLVFAMFPVLLSEREVEGFEQRAASLVVACSRRDRDIHPADRIDLVVGDFGEDDLFFHAERVIAAAVERAGRYAAEVADARHRHVDQAVEEFVHTGAPQRDLGADGHAFTQLESSDR